MSSLRIKSVITVQGTRRNLRFAGSYSILSEAGSEVLKHRSHLLRDTDHAGKYLEEARQNKSTRTNQIRDTWLPQQNLQLWGCIPRRHGDLYLQQMREPMSNLADTFCIQHQVHVYIAAVFAHARYYKRYQILKTRLQGFCMSYFALNSASLFLKLFVTEHPRNILSSNLSSVCLSCEYRFL